MARIADASLEEIRERSDIVEVVREYLPNLKRGGSAFKACCPFHQEKTPSFTVNPARQIFHCFGCHEGGDVFAFLMKYEGLSFPEAVEKLAERAGVRIQRPEEREGPKERERRGALKALEFARDYYHALLKGGAAAEPGRAYFKRRGLDAATIDRFHLGYAPRAGGLLDAAAKKGFAKDALLAAGLAAERQGRLRDYFWDRVVYPIEDARGETVGFGARTLGDAEPKYLNSPETPVFSKGKVLYGLFAALPAMRKSRCAILLEGYMDVLAAQQFGLRNAVAPLGTALTEEHAERLKRAVEAVAVVFDPDAAGIKAALRGAEMLLGRGLAVSVATLPGELDPDELLHAEGLKAFEAALAAAEDLPAFKTRLLLADAPRPLGAQAKARVAAQVLETISRCSDEILKSEWLRALAGRLSVDESALRLELGKAGASPEPRKASRAAAPAAREELGPLPVRERDILLYLFKSPGLAVDDELVAESDFSDARARRVFAALRGVLAQADAREGWTGKLLEGLDAEAGTLARQILCDERESHEPAKVLARIVGRLRKERRLAELEPLVVRGGAQAGPVPPELHREYIRLLSELKGTRKGE